MKRLLLWQRAQRLPASEIKSIIFGLKVERQLKCSTPSGIGDQINIIWVSPRHPHYMCSTPSGIGDQINVLWLPVPTSVGRAQRLPASEIKSSEAPSRELKEKFVLNAFRHRRSNQKPLSIILIINHSSAQRLPASEIKSKTFLLETITYQRTCSTPSGIGDQIKSLKVIVVLEEIVLNAFRHRRSNQTVGDQPISAPICAQRLPASEIKSRRACLISYIILHVLNAFRHRRSNQSLKVAFLNKGTCAQRLPASEIKSNAPISPTTDNTDSAQRLPASEIKSND